MIGGVSVNVSLGVCLAISLLTMSGRNVAAQQCLDWRRSQPAARTEHPIVFDSKRGVAVQFGGNDQTGPYGANGETWEWDGITWRLKAISGPSLRKQHAMAYDSARGVTVMFGGNSGYSTFGDTWEWDGTSWWLRSASGPNPVSGHSMAFDESRGVTVLFRSGSPTTTWEWNGQSWVLRSASGPPGRSGQAMTYDALRQTVLLFGGTNASGALNDLWEWDGSGNGTWTQLNAFGPEPRSSAGFTYDVARGVAVLFGGRNGQPLSQKDTWEFDSVTARWRQATCQVSPDARYRPAMCYDTVRHEVLLHAGSRDAPLSALADLWRYDATDSNWSIASVQPAVSHGTKLAYDSKRQAMVLYGRVGNVGETWEYIAGEWKLRDNSGPPPTDAHAMAFDSARGVTVLFGGYAYPNGDASGQTWEWDGGSWTLRTSTGPPARWYHGLVYDPNRMVTVLFGGTINNLDGMNDTWEWNGTQWTEKQVTAPPPREGFGMTFDAGRGRVLIYGGHDYIFPGPGNTSLRDMWEWDGTAWQERTFNLLLPFPGALMRMAMAYDSARHFTIIARPYVYGQDSSGAPVSTWQWNGNVWSQFDAPSGFPSSDHSAIAYDSDRRAMMLWRGDGSSAIWEFSLGPDCAADLNQDGLVNIDDLLIIINRWGSCVPDDCPGDANGDGVVNIDDLLAVMAAWT